MKPKFIITIFITLVAGFFFMTYYNKPHRNPKNESALTISATELFNQFTTDEAAANSLYLDKVLVVTGNVKAINRNQQNIQVITLEAGDDFFGIQCTLGRDPSAAKVNDFIAIKGICKGFLLDVVITDASFADYKN